MSPGKPITESGLAADFHYVAQGILCHGVLASICHPWVGMKVLEPGCGSGKLGLWYARYGADVTLLDVDPGVIAYSEALMRRVQDHLPLEDGWMSQHAHHVIGSIHHLVTIFGANTFDFVFNEGVPQHWTDWRRQGSINQMAAVTKPSGWVCIIGSDAGSPAMMEYAARIDHTYAGMPPKQKPWTHEELTSRLWKAGLDDVRVQTVDRMLLAAWGRKPK